MVRENGGGEKEKENITKTSPHLMNNINLQIQKV
jgi:hypothetical protein